MAEQDRSENGHKPAAARKCVYSPVAEEPLNPLLQSIESRALGSDLAADFAAASLVWAFAVVVCG